MTARREQPEVICDGCQKSGGVVPIWETLHSWRTRLARQGWKRKLIYAEGEATRHDYCPDCNNSAGAGRDPASPAEGT